MVSASFVNDCNSPNHILKKEKFENLEKTESSCFEWAKDNRELKLTWAPRSNPERKASVQYT